MKIEDYLKDLIENKYGTINKFAKIVDIPQSTLSTALGKEGGFNRMSVEKAIKICHLLNVDIETLDDIKDLNDKNESRLITIYRSVSNPGKSLMLNVCSEILKYEEMVSTPRTLKQKKEFLIAASGAEEDSDEIIDYNIELAKQITEKEERKRRKKKE